MLHDHSKHIDVHYHYIRQCVDEQKIVIEFAGMEKQLADILTKPFGRIASGSFICVTRL